MSRERRQGAALATCGGQALSHLLEQDGRIDEARSLTQRLPPDKNGFSLHDLSLLAKAYGYDGVALNIGLEDLPRLSFPAIVHIQRGDASLNGHYWVIESLDQDRLTLFDAQEPRRFVQTLSEFAREWNGDILAFGVPSELAEKRLPSWEAESIYGACCGEQRPEGDLGPPDECNLDSNGCPDWTINMLNLNIYMTDTPLWYQPAYGPGVSFKLSYNSQSALARNEIFGNKWSFEYGAYLVEDPGNSVVVVFMGSGKRLVFVQNPDGSYLRRPGHFETLNKIDATTYELNQPDGMVLRFAIPSGTSSQQPFLTQVRDPEGHFLSFEYDEDVRLVGVVDVQGRRTVLEYNTNRQVVRVTDPFGRTAQFSYDTAGNLIQIVDMAGYVSQMTYDLDANLLSLSKPEAGTWQFYIEPADGDDSIGFDPYPPFGSAMWENYRITVTHPDGEKEEFHYDGLNADSWHVPPGGYNHVSPGEPLSKFNYHIDGFSARLGRVSMAGEDIVAYAYDGFRNNFIKSDEVLTLWRTFNSDNQKISETRNPFGSSQQTTHFEYLGSTSQLRTRILRESVYSGGQFEQTMQYNSGGSPTQVILRGFTPDGTPMERVYQYTYDSLGRLIEENGPRTDVADITHYAYFTCDPGETDGHCDRLATITNALGHTTTINSYTDNGLISQMTDPNGKITVYTYDGLDRLVSVTERTELTGTDRTTLFTYTGPKRLASVTLPDGSSLAYAYDSTEKLISITDNLGNKIEYTNDANGNRIEEKVYDATNTLVRSVANVYDLRNRKTSVSSGGIVTQYGAYRKNLVGRITDGRDNATVQEYDGFGQLVKITPPAGSWVTYQYDIHGNITQAAVADGPVTNYTYDDLGNLLSEVGPDRGTIQWTYDVAGNRMSQVDGRNVSVSYSYDALNRLTQEFFSDNTTITYVYDTAPNGIGRLASVTDFSGNTSFAYNKFGQRVQKSQTVMVGAGSTPLAMQFEYDAVGRLTKKTYPSGLEVGYGYDALGRVAQIELNGEPWLTEIRYHPFGGVTELHWADGRTTLRTYDSGGKLIGHSLDTDQRAIHYDLAGNIQGLSDSSVNRVFGYDPADRLASAQGFAEDFAWQYDGYSNRTSEQQGASLDTYSYAAQSNRLLEISGAGTDQFGYDGAGNLSSHGSIAYSYNARGQLSAINNGTSTVANYQYNGFNQRVLKTVDGQERLFVYDTDGMLLSEHEADGELVVQYINFDGQVLAASTGEQTQAPVSSCQGITARVSDHMGALRAYVTTEFVNGMITVSYRAHGSHDRLGSNALATVTLYANGFNYWQVADPGNCGSPAAGACPATTASNEAHKANNRAYTQTTSGWWWLPGITTWYAQGSNDNLGTSGITLTSLYQGADGFWYKTEPANCPIEQAAGWLYYHNDHLGTPQKVTNAEGEVVWAATVNPFGDVVETVTDFEQNIRFPGQYHDRETGLYYNWHRYYSPELGRYITSDPIGLAGGLNTYAYANNNPIIFIDLYGLSPGDVTKIESKFHSTIIKMNEEGYRSKLGGWFGNLLNKTGLDEKVMQCSEQAGYMAVELDGWWSLPSNNPKDKLDDKWNIEFINNTHEINWPFINSDHYWIELQSNNPNDPRLKLDPWNNKIVPLQK